MGLERAPLPGSDCHVTRSIMMWCLRDEDILVGRLKGGLVFMLLFASFFAIL